MARLLRVVTDIIYCKRRCPVHGSTCCNQKGHRGKCQCHNRHWFQEAVMKASEERLLRIVRELKAAKPTGHSHADVQHKVFCTAVCTKHHCICRHNVRGHPSKHWCGPGSHEFQEGTVKYLYSIIHRFTCHGFCQRHGAYCSVRAGHEGDCRHYCESGHHWF